ncbi:MAG: hypothetical protein ACRCYO_00050 [Bacteroidia bacterium]
MKRILYIALPVLLFATACNRKQVPPMQDVVKADTVVTIQEPAPLPEGSVENTRLVVMFISKGAGIDLKTKESFEKWLQEQPRQVKWEITNWGREGELNFCLKLDELSTRDQEKFVEQTRIFLTDKDLVIVTENAPCDRRR